MLSPQDASRAATLLSYRLGEVAMTAAMLGLPEAAGALIEMVNWRRIAERALRRFDA